jgi:hypothetical protein
MSKKLIDDIPTLKCKRMTNKIGQGIVISKASTFQAIAMPKAMQSKCNTCWCFLCFHFLFLLGFVLFDELFLLLGMIERIMAFKVMPCNVLSVEN